MPRLIYALALCLTATGCIIVTDDDGYDRDDSGDTDTANPPSPSPGLDEGSDGSEPPPPACEIGSEGCACTTGGKCNDPFLCNENLNICVADVCPVGTEGCDCTLEGVCDPGLTCASEICVDLGCEVGTEGCACTEGGACDPGLSCLSDLCVDPDSGGSGSGGE